MRWVVKPPVCRRRRAGVDFGRLAFGFWLLAFGFWLLAFGFWLLGILKLRLQDNGHRIMARERRDEHAGDAFKWTVSNAPGCIVTIC